MELDNEKARGWLLSSIDASRHRVHLQVYMALDDDVGRPVEAALAAAGAHGVTVRVLVDSLHGLHGSLGAHNPILDRLSSRPGVELRVSKPITGPASLEDLKQRDHRKLVVVDGNVALLGGRNLSHEYYTGFGEVRLTPGTTWRVVPWLDAGARVEGPAVAVLERSFLQAWTDAGGTPFDIQDAAPAGATAARVVVHRGLRDANTLEAYLALIETARSACVRGERLPPSPRDPARAPARPQARCARPDALRQSHAEARRHAVRWPLGGGADGRHLFRALADGRAHRRRR